jgi:hypothetical protein
VHIRRFNESNQEEIDQIFNIARDEGIFVYDQDEAEEMEWCDNYYFIDRYPPDENEADSPQGEPVVSVIKFIEVVKDIYRRLEALDVIINNQVSDEPLLHPVSGRRDDNTNNNVFHVWGGNIYKTIESTEEGRHIDIDVDISYATLELKEQV